MNKILSIFAFIFPAIVYGQHSHQAIAWKPFCTDSKSFIISTIPGPDKTRAELKEIISLQANVMEDTLFMKRLVFMHAGPPSYAWSKIADGLLNGNQYWIRTTSYLHVAIYDALLAASANTVNSKRKAPYEVSSQIKKLTDTNEVYSYPCPHSIAAGAAATILSHLYPNKKDSLLQVTQNFADARVTSGLQYRSDTEAGLKLGMAIAEQVIKKADADGYAELFTDSIPKGREYYSGRPIRRKVNKMKTWILNSPGQFCPPPPPSFEEDMKLLKEYKRNDYGNFASFRWEYSWPWGEVLDQKVLEYHLDRDPLKAAFTYALVSISDYDNQVAHWDGKYTYLRARPDQYDTTFKALFPTPPSPSYPAGHGTMAYTRATVLSYLFPYDRELFFQMAKEANNSRFEAGVHFKSDNDAGETLGRMIGEEIVKRAREMETR